MKELIIIAIGIIYAILPDFFPGPIDDIIVNILTIASATGSSKMSKNSKIQSSQA